MTTQKLPDDPLDPVSPHRFAELARDADPEPGRIASYKAQSDPGSPNFGAFKGGIADSCSASQTAFPGEAVIRLRL